MKIVKKIFLFLFILFLAALLFGFGYYFAVTKNVQLDPQKLILSEKTLSLYDENGEYIPSSTSLMQQSTPIEKIPEKVKRAFIDVEDKRFYRHNGYDVRRILRATWNNIKARSFKEGASTISQQLIKNTHLTQEKTVKRKLKEWKLTRSLEKRYSKEEILERYLNTVYFGHNCFGITAASAFYFEKTPADLTLAEGAILAGLLKSPNNYSPFKFPENCRKRQAVVLRLMHENGSITESERKVALNAPLPTPSAHPSNAGYTHFVFDELTSLAEEYRFTIGGNMEIYTYLQPTLQKEIEQIAQGYTQTDKTVLVLDGETHGFKACLSTVGNIRRSPASLLKPLLVYAPAIEENLLSPATPVLDAKINYGGYSPDNYDGKYHGYISARECLEKSLNVPAVKVLESLTLQKGTAYLQKLGLPVSKADESLALALGGMQEGYTFKELCSAYSALQNQGNLPVCGFISRIKINGATVYEKPTTKTRVFSEESACLTTDMLKTTAQKGTAKKLRTLPFEIAAKTGTAGTKKGNTDAYTLSYTQRDCVGVWLGNADNTPIDTTGGGLPCNLSYQIQQLLYDIYGKKGETIPPFPISANVVSVDLDKTAYYDTHTLSLADDLAPEQYRISELFKKDAIPLNKSLSFTNPSIVSPTLSVENGRVTLRFDERSPRYYTYKIQRYDYATHTTVYEGEYLPFFTDECLSPNKKYVYIVTPFYKDREGTSIRLPSITTNFDMQTEKDDEPAIPKEWWKE